MVMDAHGDLFVANQNDVTPSVTEYTPPFSTGQAASETMSVAAFPRGLALDYSGHLFVTSCLGCTGLGPGDGGVVAIFAPPYTGTAALVSSGAPDGSSVAVDAAANLYLTNSRSVGGVGASSFLRYAAPYTGTPTKVLGFTIPFQILVTP
jgi:hypothetical protein